MHQKIESCKIHNTTLCCLNAYVLYHSIYEGFLLSFGSNRAQLGYTHQMLGTNEEAMKLYNQVLKSK